MSGIIGGDEVGAVVLDFGSFSSRVGYAGEDMPKADFPSYVGIIDDYVDKNDAMDGPDPIPQKKYLFDTPAIKAPRKNMNLQPILNNHGLVEDLDLFEKVLDFTFNKHLRCESSTHPILMSEPVSNTKDKREKLCELFFEKYNAPGFYLSKNAVLSSFACNRTSGLVLDCGAIHTTAIPIHDGFVLQKGVSQSPLGGDFVLGQCRQFLEENAKIEIVPYYQVKSKEVVKSGDPAKFVRRDLPGLTESYKRFMLKDALLDFASHVLHVSDTKYNETEMSLAVRIPYEFPNGFNTDFGEERFRIAETLFDPSIVKGIQPNSMLDIVHLITSSIGMCDPELRPGLFSNIMVVGGNSLLMGFVDRLNFEFNHLNYKTKIFALPTVTERRFSSWIGGSILGSLGTFHQMWISKQEYEENGRVIVDKKCH